MNPRIRRMDQAGSPDDGPRETNVQFVVIVEVCKLFAVVKETRESVISAWQYTLLHSELFESVH